MFKETGRYSSKPNYPAVPSDNSYPSCTGTLSPSKTVTTIMQVFGLGIRIRVKCDKLNLLLVVCYMLSSVLMSMPTK